MPRRTRGRPAASRGQSAAPWRNRARSDRAGSDRVSTSAARGIVTEAAPAPPRAHVPCEGRWEREGKCVGKAGRALRCARGGRCAAPRLSRVGRPLVLLCPFGRRKRSTSSTCASPRSPSPLPPLPLLSLPSLSLPSLPSCP
eukprot:1291436-Prymnesium_polylepis.1